MNRRMLRDWALGAALVLSVNPALAQDPAAPAPEPPSGPAEIFQRTNNGRDRQEMERAAQAGENAAQQAKPAPQPAAPAPAPAANAPANAPSAAPANAGHGAKSTGTTAPVADEAAPPGDTPAAPEAAPPGAPSDHDVQAVLSEPAMPTAVPASDLPLGAIDIEVISPTGQPYGGAEIVLGVMASQGGRSEKRATAGADGRYAFRDLPVGSKQAYRVNVLFSGAKFSSTPFRMPESGGYRVRVPLIGTTHEDRMIFQVVGQTVVELRDDRLHITQQARLANAGHEVFVLPKDGQLLPLPPGFTAFQWQDQMSDQHATEEAGKGIRLRGSLPPGAVTLAWSFDLKRDGSTAKIPVSMPFRTYTYRVISEAPQGLELKVADFPEPERVKDQGRDLLFTQVKRSPEDTELASFSIKLEGIPGPGPGRWVALALALMLAAFGLSRAFAGGQSSIARRTVVQARKQHLLEAAKRAEAELSRGEIGPEFHARRMDELTTELAMVLRDEESLPTA